jgi:hypothetical protein
MSDDDDKWTSSDESTSSVVGGSSSPLFQWVKGHQDDYTPPSQKNSQMKPLQITMMPTRYAT